jgi:hypothetical protein
MIGTQLAYLLEVLVLPVELMVSEPFFFLCLLLLLFMVPLSFMVLPVDVFWAKTAETGRSERPRAAIMIFFIWGYLLIYVSGSTECSQ